MKLLHTADLHLGLHRGGICRWDDHMEVLDEILLLTEEHEVDTVLFAGDILNDRTRRDLSDIACDFLKKLIPSLRRGIDIVLLPGNHDNRELFRLMGTLLKEIAGEDTLPLLICHNPGVYDLRNRKELQIVALPYLSPNELRLESSFSSSVIEGDELHQTLGSRIEQGLRWLETEVDGSRPAIFVGHILVTGSNAMTGIELDYAHDVAIAPQSLPHYTQYNALGHVHLSQKIVGANCPSWYSGSPDRQDLGERAYKPSILLVNLTMKPGEYCAPIELSIQSATPYIKKSLEGADDVKGFLESEPSPRTLGTIQIRCTVDKFADLRQGILDICPRLDVSIDPIDIEQEVSINLPEDPYDVRSNVLGYLEEAFSGEELKRLKNAFAELYGEKN
jgi:DNA repair protein SbcD/Mre11